MPFKSTPWLMDGYKTLNVLWDRGLVPKDLELHYFLHWFVLYEGNIVQTASALRVHRNNIQGHFRKFGFANKTYSLRDRWVALLEDHWEDSFETNFFKFFSRFNTETKFTPDENAHLAALWQSKFPFKTLLAHYALWAVRAHKPADWVQKKLDYSYRHHLRLLTSLLSTKTRNGFWLSPLKPSVEEIYSERYRNGFLKNKELAKQGSVA
jgi:hypothetical protein